MVPARPAPAHLALALLAGAGCVRQLPPAARPAEVVPAGDLGPPPAPGLGRLVVDVVDGPQAIAHVEMRARPFVDAQGASRVRFAEAAEQLCAASPCVADLPVGNHLIGFPVLGDPDALESELVHVEAGGVVYRRALSLYRDETGATRTLGIVGASVGGAALITGAVLLPIGLAGDSGGLTVAGGLSLGVGTALLALGIAAIRHDAPTFRPGNAALFPLAPAGPGR